MRTRFAAVALTLAGLSACAPVTPEQSARLMAFGGALKGAGQAGQPSAYAPPDALSPPMPGMICTLRAQIPMGAYRNCVYSCGGGVADVAQMVGVADVCLTSVQMP